MIDITDPKQAEETLRASEKRYRLLFERNMAGVLRTGVDGTVLEVNDAFARILGFGSREDLRASRVMDFYYRPADCEAMLERLLSNGVRTIVVETANRFARDLMVQEVGFAMLKERGIILIAADSPDAFLDDTPTSRLIRQVLGSVSEFEKAMLVSKLRGARERKRANGHKVEGRKSHAEARPEVVALAKTLRQRLHRGHAMSFRNISAELFALGHASKSGKAFTASSVRKMLV